MHCGDRRQQPKYKVMAGFPGSLGHKVFRLSTKVYDKVLTWFSAGAFAEFGSRTTIQFPCRIDKPGSIHIGSGVFIGRGGWLATQAGEPGAAESAVLRIGNGVSMSGSCVLSAAREVIVEDYVLFARNVYVSDHGHAFGRLGIPVMHQGLTKVQPVRIGRGAWLGQNVVVCPGVTIGEGAVIGANSVVNCDVPSYTLAVGAPARVLRSFRDDCERDPALLEAK